MEQKIALITGASGQDGSYMVDLLLAKDYKVHVLSRYTSSASRSNWRLARYWRNAEDKHPNFELHFGDLTDAGSLLAVIKKVEPNEIYNFAAQGSVQVSWQNPEYTADVNGLGVVRLLEIIRALGLIEKTRLYQASTCEIFGTPTKSPQTEDFPIDPQNPYAIAKSYAHHMVKTYRRQYGLFASNAILYAHDSPRRDEHFVFKKITQSLVRLKYGQQDTLFLGNLDARKDWGYAKDYVEAIWLMLQQDKADDYILASGSVHTIREIIKETCSLLALDLEWRGSGREEQGINRQNGKTIIKLSEKFFRHLDPNSQSEVLLKGDISKAKKVLGWEPKTGLKDLVALMVAAGEKELQYYANN